MMKTQIHTQNVKQLIKTSLLMWCYANMACAANVDEGACPVSDESAKGACIQLYNSGSVDIKMQVRVPAEPGVRTAATGSYIHHDFAVLNGGELFTLLPNFEHVITDASCSKYTWANNLAVGKSFVVTDLEAKIYEFSYGYTKDANDDYIMVNCSSNITL